MVGGIGDCSPDSPLDCNDGVGTDRASPGYFGIRRLMTGGARAQIGFVRKKFSAYFWPCSLSIMFEVLFCASMSSWTDTNEAAAGSRHKHWESIDEAHMKEWYWGVFTFCLTMRLLCVFMWKRHVFRLKDSTYSGMYMCFSTVQWVFYLAAYYWLTDELTAMSWKPEVQVSYTEKHFEPHAGKLPVGQRKVVDLTFSACLEKFDLLTCRNLTSQQVVCREAFEKSVCSGWVWLGSRAQGEIKCCVRNRYSLAPPDPMVPMTPFDMQSFFPFLQWLAVLVMSWMIRDTPMLPASQEYSNFMNGCWLDILDAVLFGDYILNKKVWYPAYGIRAEPPADVGLAGPEDDEMQVKVWRCWVLALSTAVIAPVLYTVFRREDAHTRVASRAEETQTVDECMKHLVHNIRLLDRKGAASSLESTLRLQKEHYISASAADDLHPVLVYEEEPSILTEGLVTGRGSSRKGMARLHHEALGSKGGWGHYRVKYDGDDVEEMVPVDHIEPVLEEHARMCGPKCCWGWCGISSLKCEGPRRQYFERWAAVLDACRSLFLLELPFFMWRLYFDSADLGSNTISFLMLKNLVWGLTDFLTILACGNDKATCLAYQPIQFVTTHINGTILSFIWVGPAGLFRLVADVLIKSAEDRIAARQNQATVHKAWLIVERQKAIDCSNDDAAELYDSEIARLDGLIDDLNKEAAMNHL